MRVSKKDIDNLNVLASASKLHTNEINEAIRLYKKRKIERVQTAEYIVKNYHLKVKNGNA
jgi:DNA-binding Lrp family transcriptional regulator